MADYSGHEHEGLDYGYAHVPVEPPPEPPDEPVGTPHHVVHQMGTDIVVCACGNVYRTPASSTVTGWEDGIALWAKHQAAQSAVARSKVRQHAARALTDWQDIKEAKKAKQ